ncbi:SUKH-4 family immunity protein [Streptomyces sp. NPDC058369]|uniref:SUKH-4 family immunity protein n=1 Tax=unclassified Streptomyces TaxID=2593676 RepID=UPI00225373EE|nr:SUKH-4 family immunity protein [Streptomyces sp. NBC_01789]MCX4451744.1 sporulation initiation factor Spo0A C-terminal domain-containing protein [Streptomyces sp. NBC_01789]
MVLGARIAVPTTRENEDDVRVMRDLPPLSLPQYVVVRIGCSPEVPTEIAADLREIGVPAGLIGYEYQPLAEAAVLGGMDESGLVVFGTSGLFGHIAIEVASRRIVHMPMAESSTTNHVNRDLEAFHRCVAATIARFPFYEEGEEDRFEEAAGDLRELLATLDDTALAHNGLWETLCDDVAMGDYANWED